MLNFDSYREVRNGKRYNTNPESEISEKGNVEGLIAVPLLVQPHISPTKVLDSGGKISIKVQIGDVSQYFCRHYVRNQSTAFTSLDCTIECNKPIRLTYKCKPNSRSNNSWHKSFVNSPLLSSSSMFKLTEFYNSHFSNSMELTLCKFLNLSSFLVLSMRPPASKVSPAKRVFIVSARYLEAYPHSSHIVLRSAWHDAHLSL